MAHSKVKDQYSDKQNMDSVNARGAKAKGSSHGQAGRFGNTDTEPPPRGRANAGSR